MINEEKIIKIQNILENPGRVSSYYKLLEDMGDMKYNYREYLESAPVNCEYELRKLSSADYELCTALFTMILREDYFSNGSFERRLRNGQVEDVLKRMIKLLSEDKNSITYTREEIIKVFNKKELKDGLEKYIEIMELLHKTDVSTDKDFQKKYNHFYRMRQRTSQYYQIYFDYMEQQKSKAKSLSFRDILLHIKNETNRCEASFSSKLLATLNPDMPVWDSNVLTNLGIKQIPSYAKDREQKIADVYEQICLWYDEFLKSDEASLVLQIFDEMFPNVNITNTKKVDFFLWQY